ncbi:hypothetical protein DFA_02184 [Cavenderia fasciculata]|uniref:Phospholipid/glycerol acyltransferase domain-containing protein n=1 Tax=Cavenderia fasciculata TaxID=261658 RepID=F4PYD0_CACFS|nr:uncharacterized protein DFA_02184 [Cavenderia fasciculata]EGG19397.1 hypothetical protein DFA_02184 [Cavenderia fasciculata]|eukprot:XP_004357668.1 hypothetical protein DFA_02184 [Cavenderia fasciculata]
MDVKQQQQQQQQQKPRPIYKNAFVTIALFVMSIATILMIMLPIEILQIFNPSLAFTLNTIIASQWYRFMLFIFQVVNQINVNITGEKELPQGECALIMVNHPSEVDWLFLWFLAIKQKALSKIKFILKNEIRFVPLVGWGCDNIEYIYLTRDWEYDEAHLRYKLTKMRDVYQTKPWVTIFPEGTDIDKTKLEKSWAYAEKNGFPKFNNVLLPRTKGVQACLDVYRDTFDAVYDVTMSYDCGKPTIPSLLLSKNPNIVNINVGRIPISQVPKTEDKLQPWLFKIYQEKDKLLQYQKDNGKYPFNSIANQEDHSIYLAGLVWSIGILFTIYNLFTSSTLRWYALVSMIFYAVSASSNKLREMRGLNRPGAVYSTSSKKQQ